MAKIEDIHTAICNLVSSTVADYKRFPNPYQIDANTFLHMKKGYGVAIGPGVDTERYLGCHVTYSRVFTLVLVQQMTETQNTTARRELIERDLLEDHDSLIKAVYNNTTLAGVVIKATITDDGGIQFIDGDRLKFLALEMNMTVEYQDTLT